LLKVVPKAEGCKATVKCDALLLDDLSVSDTYPVMQIDNGDVSIAHEATVGKIGAEQLFYLQARGLSEDQAASLIVQGFVEPIVRELPMEYAVELNRLITMEMEGSVG
jgi:Fe-S cluster assembly protein SufB